MSSSHDNASKTPAATNGGGRLGILTLKGIAVAGSALVAGFLVVNAQKRSNPERSNPERSNPERPNPEPANSDSAEQEAPATAEDVPLDAIAPGPEGSVPPGDEGVFLQTSKSLQIDFGKGALKTGLPAKDPTFLYSSKLINLNESLMDPAGADDPAPESSSPPEAKAAAKTDKP